MEHKRNIGEDIIAARVLYYDFFTGLFLFELLKNRSLLLQKQIALLENFAFSDKNTQDFHALQNSLQTNGIEIFIQEFTALFSLPFVPENQKSYSPVYLYLSYYLEGCIGGSGLLLAKDIFKSSSFYLNPASLKETEENFGVLLLAMEHFLQNKNQSAKELFNKCISPMIAPITQGISKREDCPLYGHINNILIEFLELEKKIFQE